MMKMKRKIVLLLFCSLLLGMFIPLQSARGYEIVNELIGSIQTVEDNELVLGTLDESDQVAWLAPGYEASQYNVEWDSEGGATDRVRCYLLLNTGRDIEEFKFKFEITGCNDHTIYVYLLIDDNDDGEWDDSDDILQNWGNLAEGTLHTRDKSLDSDVVLGIRFYNTEFLDDFIVEMITCYAIYHI